MRKIKISILDVVFYVIIVIVSTMVFVMIMCAVDFLNKSRTKNIYCGVVLDRYITSGGYRQESAKHIIFYNDLLKKNIDVRVSNQTYANAIKGSIVCFELNKNSLKD